MTPRLHFVVPGRLDQRTGGYLYDARMVGGLRRLGWEVVVHELEGSFPDADATAEAALADALTSLPDGTRVVVDGLALGGLPGPARAHAGRLRLIALVHHPLADETGLSDADRARYEASERAAVEVCVGVIATSPFTARRLADFGVPPRSVRAVLPGTDEAGPALGPDPGAPPRLICVGTVTPRKGHDVLVAALERLRALDWSAVCVGALDRDSDWVRFVLGQVEGAGLTDRIAFVGECGAHKLDAFYAASSVFVLASHYEGYGMALTEALARGLPVVSTTGGAIPSTVPAECGVLVEPGRPDALAEALRSLLEDPTKRATLADAARRHAKTLPSRDAAARAFATAVEELGG